MDEVFVCLFLLRLSTNALAKVFLAHDSSESVKINAGLENEHFRDWIQDNWTGDNSVRRKPWGSSMPILLTTNDLKLFIS